MRFREVKNGTGPDWPLESGWRHAVRFGASLTLLAFLGSYLLILRELL